MRSAKGSRSGSNASGTFRSHRLSRRHLPHIVHGSRATHAVALPHAHHDTDELEQLRQAVLASSASTHRSSISMPPGHHVLPFAEWMKLIQDMTEQVLQSHLPSTTNPWSSLPEAMRYATLAGGKRIRPLLVFAAGEVFDADPGTLSRCAAAVEMIHVNSLVHDDMPCMDNDVLRRGKPTVHIKYDEATALLVGDALQSQAYFALSDHEGVVNAGKQLLIIRLLAQTVGSSGMCAGQSIDLASHGAGLSLAELEDMHRLKTGALLRTAVLLGALSGRQLSVPDVSALHTYAHAIGLAFQVIDDLLDATVDSATLGKTAGKDARDGKSTYVSLLGVDRAKAIAQTLIEEAHVALNRFGSRAHRLHDIANLIVHRRM
jgi:farnesyl diphosphate synthase